MAGLWAASRRRPAAAAYGDRVNPPGAGWQPPPEALRIGVYNIQGGKGTDGKRSLARIADTIRDADIIGLCEVWDRSLGSYPQVRHLAELLELGWLYLPTHDRWFRPIRGHGLLTRIPACWWYREPLPDSTGKRPRALSEFRLQWGETPLAILLAHTSRHEDQDVQLRRVFDRFRQFPRVVLMGDLNVTRKHPLLHDLIGEPDVVDALGNRGGENRIDWILTRGIHIADSGWTPPGPSDHPFVWIQITRPRSVSHRPLRTIST